MTTLRQLMDAVNRMPPEPLIIMMIGVLGIAWILEIASRNGRNP